MLRLTFVLVCCALFAICLLMVSSNVVKGHDGAPQCSNPNMCTCAGRDGRRWVWNGLKWVCVKPRRIK